MLRTINQWRDNAEDLIHRYAAWCKADVDRVLTPRNGNPPGRIEVEAISEKAGSFARQARALLEQPDAKTPENADHAADLTDIADELDLAAAEGAILADPDAVWTALDAKSKRAVTQKIPVARTNADRLRARIRGDLRKQTPPAK